MIFGFALFVLGYTLFYWGIHHFPGMNRYSLWTLFGFSVITPGGGVIQGSLYPKLELPEGIPFYWKTQGGTVPTPSTGTGKQPTTPAKPAPKKSTPKPAPKPLPCHLPLAGSTVCSLIPKQICDLPFVGKIVCA